MDFESTHDGPTQRGGRKFLISSWIVGGIAVVVGLVPAIFVPSFVATFEELGAALPAITEAIINVPLVGWVAAGFLGGAILITKDLLVPRGVAFGINLLAIVGVCVFMAALVLGLFLPLIEIVEELEG